MALLQLGVATAATMATPWPLKRLAMAQSAAPHFLIVMICDGGWDVTQVFDVHEQNLGYDVTSLDLSSGELRLIENDERPFRREIGCAVVIDARHEAQGIGFDDGAHFRCEHGLREAEGRHMRGR